MAFEACRTQQRPSRRRRSWTMRSVLLLVLGVPIPIILLLAFCTHHF
jgi:hypothetical protein